MNRWVHKYADINGLNVHYVEQGEGPLVVLLHGFPHTWFSWRHQIGPLADAGYRVVAPDLRGLGQSEAPADPTAYSVRDTVGDLIGLLDHLGEEQAIFSGLDYGIFAAYDLSRHHPERMRAIIGLQNPFIPPNSELPSIAENVRSNGGKNFNHMTFMTDDPARAIADFDAHPREMLAGIFYALSGDFNFTDIWRHPRGITYREALPAVPEFPWPWLTEWELEMYVSDYSRSGFASGILRYTLQDSIWRYRQGHDAYRQPSPVPFYFIGSEQDVDLEVWQGHDPLENFHRHHSDVRLVEIVKGGGHMLNMEQHEAVTAAMLVFLADLDRANAVTG